MQLQLKLIRQLIVSKDSDRINQSEPHRTRWRKFSIRPTLCRLSGGLSCETNCMIQILHTNRKVIILTYQV